MNKLKKIFISNLIISILLFLMLDFVCYYKIRYDEYWQQEHYSILHSLKEYLFEFQPRNLNFRYYKNEYIFNKHNKSFRVIENKRSNKKTIVLFGDSYAFGYNLYNDETFSYYLGKYTNRPIYNRAMSGCSINHMLYQLQDKDFYKLVPKPEYVIYTFIKWQPIRLYRKTTTFIPNIYYKYTKNKLNLKRYYLKEIISRSSIFYYRQNWMYKQKNWDLIEKVIPFSDLDFVNIHFLESKREIEKHWGKDVKFVIFLYEEPYYITRIKPLIDKLKQEGFIIININDLSKTNLFTIEYQLTRYDKHPNNKAWKYITPLIINKLKL